MTGCRGKLTQEIIDGVAKAVEEDMPNIEACALFRIGETTYYRWKAQGEQDLEAGIDSLERKFWEAIKTAESRAIERGLACIRKASDNQWQAGAWILERCYRKRFSQYGDQFEKLERQIAELAAKVERRKNKSLGAKAIEEETKK